MERDKDLPQSAQSDSVEVPKGAEGVSHTGEGLAAESERIEAIIQPLEEAQERAAERAQSGIEQVTRAGADVEQIAREAEAGDELVEGVENAVSQATERVQEIAPEAIVDEGHGEGFFIQRANGALEFQKISSPRGPRTPEQDAAVIDRRQDLEKRISEVDKKLADLELEASDPLSEKKRDALMDRKAKAQRELDSISKYYPEVSAQTAESAPTFEGTPKSADAVAPPPLPDPELLSKK